MEYFGENFERIWKEVPPVQVYTSAYRPAASRVAPPAATRGPMVFGLSSDAALALGIGVVVGVEVSTMGTDHHWAAVYEVVREALLHDVELQNCPTENEDDVGHVAETVADHLVGIFTFVRRDS